MSDFSVVEIVLMVEGHRRTITWPLYHAQADAMDLAQRMTASRFAVSAWGTEVDLDVGVRLVHCPENWRKWWGNRAPCEGLAALDQLGEFTRHVEARTRKRGERGAAKDLTGDRRLAAAMVAINSGHSLRAAVALAIEEDREGGGSREEVALLQAVKRYRRSVREIPS